jgi:hypothetical protein
MAGLTEVADAIALAKPVVVTPSSAFPYELDTLGAGTMAHSDSAESLLAAIQTVVAQGANADRMRERFNAEAFAGQLERQFALVIDAEAGGAE